MIHWYVHRCGTCGTPVRRHRQSTQAAWYKRNNLEPKPWPITWVDASGSQDCTSIHARRYRKEQGWREVFGSDLRHYALDHATSEREVTS